jgi:purine-binding chemotaxis protein CheW
MGARHATPSPEARGIAEATGPSGQSCSFGVVESAEDILRRRAQELAQAKEERESKPQHAVLSFKVSDEWCAVPVAAVREIVRDFAVTPLPCVPARVLGVTNLRGEIVSVTGATELLQLGSAGSVGPKPSVAIVLTDGALATAFVVDEVGDIIEVDEAALEPVISMSDRGAECFSAVLESRGRLMSVIDVRRVLDPVRSEGPERVQKEQPHGTV